MRGILALAVPIVLLWVPPRTIAGQSPLRRVFGSDTMTLGFPTVSPDGRWLVFQHRVDNQKTRLLIRELPNGEPRELVEMRGNHNLPRFTPTGDRLFFNSTLPRRGAADDRMYLMAAPFDTRTGTLSGEPRQITLDGVRSIARATPVLSPDGQWVAYVNCCENADLKVVPSAGGNARILAQGVQRFAPGWIGWTSDSRFVTYELRNADGGTRFRVSRDGGSPTVVTRLTGPGGVVSPDGKYVATLTGNARRVLELSTADGSLIAAVPATGFSPPSLSFSVDGKYLIGASDNSTASVKLVPLAGGPIRQLGPGDSYEWPVGWSEDSREAHIGGVERGREVVLVVSLDGTVKNKVFLPDGSGIVGLRAGTLVYRERVPGKAATHRLIAMKIADGSKKVLMPDAHMQVCCGPVAAGGMYYGIYGEEFYVRDVAGNRLQLRAMRLDGSSRLVAEVPVSLHGRTGFAIYKDRVVYAEPAKDSMKLQMTIGGGRVTTLATFPAAILGEFVWSYDGRQLSLYTNTNPWKLMIFRFDSTGVLQGTPRTLDVPFEYAYETFWLPDGSGLTMIAQPRGAAVSEVALVKLNDPAHPILLTKEDPVSKWGHALSPDGKYVAYPSEQRKGSSIYLIEVANLLKKDGK